MIRTALIGMAALILSAAPGKNLERLWDSYKSATDNDKPQEQLDILRKIKDDAKKEHSAWDFYQACDKYVSVSGRTNWKQYDSLRKAMDEELKDFGEPVMLFYHDRRNSDGTAFIEANRDRLRSSKNPEFWKNDYRIAGCSYCKALAENFSNDLDYACWVVGENNFKGRYPLEGLYEFSKIEYMDTTAYSSYAGKYDGRAVALLAKEALLQSKWQRLEYNPGHSSSEDFIALRKECEQFNADRKTFRDKEKTIAEACTLADGLIESLDERNISASIENGVLYVHFQNLRTATVEILSGKKAIFSRNVTNRTGSYHRIDTVEYTLPPIDDGDYALTCKSGALKNESDYRKHTLSLATRRNSDGCQAFVADYMSGEPVDGKGFFPLEAGTKEYSYSFRDKSGVLRSSTKVNVNTNPLTVDLSDDNALRCEVFTDRGFYAPGDTIRFKAVLYNGKYTLRNPGAGIRVKASLLDTRGVILAEEDLVTNGFGSVAGEFEAVLTDRNGSYSLRMDYDGKSRTHFIRVDDIVLPDFELSFEGGSNEQLKEIPDTLSVKGTVISYSGHPLSSARISYTVKHNREDKNLAEGTLIPDPNGRFSIDFPSKKTDIDNHYDISVKVVDATGETHEFNKTIWSSRQMSEQRPSSHYFEELGENSLGCRIVAGDKPVWATVTIYGAGNVILEDRLIHFKPVDGVAGTTVSYVYQDSYPDVVSMEILYFQDGKAYRHSQTARREINVWDLPVTFSRFKDTAYPGTEYTFGIGTGPGVECAVSVFDKSTETVSSNKWHAIRPQYLPAPRSDTNYSPGQDRSVRVFMTKARMAMANALDGNPEIAEDEAIPFQIVGHKGPGDIYLRENFANTLAWEPFLHSDANGDVSFNFRTSDKLSTYFVQVFAHNKAMQNGTARREMMVTIPVKVAVREPRFLYEGDSYVVHATVSNSTDTAIAGKVTFNDGGASSVTVPANGQAEVSCPVPIDGNVTEGKMPLTVVFTADNPDYGSDGIRVYIPIAKPVQTVTEAHSSLLLSGQDRDALIGRLRAEFTNVPGSDAEVREISILDMVKEALPDAIEPKSDDILSLSDALLARKLAGTDSSSDEILRKIAACRNADGGYAWYAGLSSSPILTAVLLERLEGTLPETNSAVKYLDRQYFTEKLPYWRGGLSLEQYLHVRSIYAIVPLSEKTDREFRKAAKAYLIPKGERGLAGQIFRKARRIETLRRLEGSEDGIKLARQWGIGLFTSSRITSSEQKDMASLAQYAVKHPSGGVYFPNAVMPWRGLLESELYAHNMLSRLLDGRDDSISNGIRLWTMVQKETQKWDSDPAYIEAIQNVLKAPEDILDTKVVALKGTFTKPFGGIRAAGNGFSISSAIHVSDGSDGNSQAGRSIGDKVTLVYTVRNDENRSFVKLTLPFPAGLIPVRQESGLYGWNGYRSVGKDRTEYWFDTYPEETTTIREEFYVSQEGSFQCPAPTVECLYADHYRANGDAPEVFNTTR